MKYAKDLLIVIGQGFTIFGVLVAAVLVGQLVMGVI